MLPIQAGDRGRLWRCWQSPCPKSTRPANKVVLVLLATSRELPANNDVVLVDPFLRHWNSPPSPPAGVLRGLARWSELAAGLLASAAGFLALADAAQYVDQVAREGAPGIGVGGPQAWHDMVLTAQHSLVVMGALLLAIGIGACLHSVWRGLPALIVLGGSTALLVGFLYYTLFTDGILARWVWPSTVVPAALPVLTVLLAVLACVLGIASMSDSPHRRPRRAERAGGRVRQSSLG